MYIDIFNQINSNDGLDLDKLEAYLNGLNYLSRQISNMQNDNKSDQNNGNE